ncbi:MAG: isopentenyl transferase family protein [Acidimicrobiales bacterium]
MADRDSFADLFSGHYTDREPASALVADLDGQVVGYLLGCRDSTAVPDPAPMMVRHLVGRALLVRPGTAGVLWRSIGDVAVGVVRGRGLDTELHDPRWPAHLHINLLPVARGGGVGRRLVSTWLDALRRRRLRLPPRHLGRERRGDRLLRVERVPPPRPTPTHARHAVADGCPPHHAVDGAGPRLRPPLVSPNGRSDRPPTVPPGSAPPLALLGVTASGKSSLALALARRRGDVELVSVDSMQVYRGMDVGTAKPTAAEQAEVRHHVIDLVDPWERFEVHSFQAAVREALADIAARERRAVLVGGTGLYLRAVVDDLDLPGRFPDVAADLEAEPDTPGSTDASPRSTRSPPPAWSRRTDGGSCERSR